VTRYEKGARLERDIVNYLRDRGYGALRAAGSGPVDVVAYTPSEGHVVMECKVRRSDVLYVPKEDVTKLEEFAKTFDATPFIAWRPAHRRLPRHPLNVVLVRPEDTEETTSSRKITLESAVRKGLSLEALLTDRLPL